MAYAIRPLKWSDAQHEYSEAKSLIGWLYVRRVSDRLTWSHPAGQQFGLCDSIEDGKAKAEDYYREMLMAALEPVTPTREDE
jgi:hypothetical protein